MGKVSVPLFSTFNFKQIKGKDHCEIYIRSTYLDNIDLDLKK